MVHSGQDGLRELALFGCGPLAALDFGADLLEALPVRFANGLSVQERRQECQRQNVMLGFLPL